MDSLPLDHQRSPPINFLILTLNMKLAKKLQGIGGKYFILKIVDVFFGAARSPKGDVLHLPVWGVGSGCRHSQTQMQKVSRAHLAICRILLTRQFLAWSLSMIEVNFAESRVCLAQLLLSFLLGNERGTGPNLFSFSLSASSVWSSTCTPALRGTRSLQHESACFPVLPF